MSIFGTEFSWSDNTCTFVDGCMNNLNEEFKNYFAARNLQWTLHAERPCLPSRLLISMGK